MSDWISVETKLPEADQSVLCFGKNGILIGRFHKSPIGSYWLSDKMEHIEFMEEFEPITHWMPLPEPPMIIDAATDLVDFGSKLVFDFVNASHVNENYRPVNKPIRIEL